MRVLISTPVFHPSVGGIETMTDVLSTALASLGHEVTVVTLTRAPADSTSATMVERAPTSRRLWWLCRQADVVIHNQLSLRLAWPSLLLRWTKCLVVSHTWIPHPGSQSTRAERLKLAIIASLPSAAVSEQLAASLPGPVRVIPNAYRTEVFAGRASTGRKTTDIVFVGRLVSDKGVHVLLKALQQMQEREGRSRRVAIVGDGPERQALVRDAVARGLDDTTFLGQLTPLATAGVLANSRVVVVPSVWPEPFGLAALEGLASGCLPVVTTAGGLPEAAGPVREEAPPGDPSALAVALERGLRRSDPWAPSDLQAARAHLARHTPSAMAAAYLDAAGHPRRPRWSRR